MARSLKGTILLAAVFGAGGCAAEAEPTTESAGEERQQITLGPKDGHELPPTDLDRVRAGDLAPDFSAASLAGPVVTLSQFRGTKNVVLFFYRGHWWPYCAKQLGELQGFLTPEQREGTEILALSSDGPAELQMMVDRVAREHDGYVIEYTLLSDPGAAIINRYGLFNQEDPRGRAIPHPTVYVIDREGVVRWKFTEVNYRVRPENADILAALAEIGG